MSVRFVPPMLLIVLVAALIGVGPLRGDELSFFRDGFAGRNTGFVRGDANVRFEEKDHKLSDTHCKSALTSEHIRVEANPPAGASDAEFIHYYYTIPPAPVTNQLTASVWIKAYRTGVQVKARLVLPKEKDPRNPDAPLTTLITGDTYEKARQWQRLTMGDVSELVKKHMPVLHARIGRAVDPTDAYLDQIVVNVYSGAGITDVWIDDLEVGPVRGELVPPRGGAQAPGLTTGLTGPSKSKILPVEFSDGQILVDGEPLFMLAIRHTGTPLKTLRDARLNTVWFPSEVPNQTIEESIRHGFWIVPTLPLPAGEWEDRKPKRPDPATLDKDADTVAQYLRKFASNDAVLMWDFGSGRTAEDVYRVARASELVRSFDPRRPRSVDLWDGYSAYASYVNAIGVHRWPLFSSLEMSQYREWLSQRKALVPPGKLTWTWVQTHLPDWYVQLLCGRPDPAAIEDPVGPHPEQIRILTYLSLAAGHRGIGYWSDKFLENPFHGRDRLIELAMLNTEIEMLKPVLYSAQDSARWYATGDSNVQAAVIRGAKEILVLPVWMGAGTQYTPAQGALPTLTVRIPAVPDGAIPWLITPAGITELKGVKRVAGGTEIEIPEFDITAAVVFTSDLGPTGKVVRWQDHTRTLAPLMARYAQQQAIEQFNKAWATHQKILAAGGPDLPNGESADLFARSRKFIHDAKCFADNNQHDVAFREARRALRPLRILMRAHWQKATESLDIPTASPYAVSFYSLPQHWQMAREMAVSRPGSNVFVHGGFELNKPAPETGAEVSSLPGWQVRKLILDPTSRALAAIINTEGIEDKPPEEPLRSVNRYSTQRVMPLPTDFRQPNFGKHCLTIAMDYKQETDNKGRKLSAPQAAERAVIAVDSPPVELPPGTLVRISFWVKVPGTLASADGLLVFDSAGGEPLGVRLQNTAQPPNYTTTGWKQYHLYRRVPPTGKISMTFALSGFGSAYIDDVKIEPMNSSSTTERIPPATRRTEQPTIVPTGFRNR